MPIIGTLPNTISNGQTIDAVPVMADLNFIVSEVNANAAALSNTALLNAANSFTQRQSGVSAGAAANFPIASQIQDSVFLTLTSTLGKNTITARCAALPLTAYAARQIFSFSPSAGNSGASTINIEGLGAINLGKTLSSGFTVLSSDDLKAGMTALIGLTSTATRAQLLNPVTVPLAPLSSLIVRRKTADESVTSTTLQDDDHLSFPIGPNEEWVADISLDVGAVIFASGIKLAVTTPSGATQNIIAALVPDTLDPTLSAQFKLVFRTTTSGAALDFPLGNLGGIADAYVKVSVWVLNGATAGSVTLQFARSGVSDTLTSRKGGQMVAHRVA